MGWKSDLMLVAAGAIAASVNAAAGGGTLLSFPALLWAGLPALAANATSTVGLLPGNVGSLWGLRDLLASQKRDAWIVGICSTVGGVIGALLLLWLGGKVFERAVPVLLVGASGLLLSQPLVARLVSRGGAPHEKGPAIVFAANFLIAIYGGYFGAGQGILFLGAIGLLTGWDLRRVNALKVLAALVANFISAATFIAFEIIAHPHAVVWRPMLPLALGSLLGGYLGVKIVVRLPAQALRAFASAVGLAIAVWFIVR